MIKMIRTIAMILARKVIVKNHGNRANHFNHGLNLLLINLLNTKLRSPKLINSPISKL